MGTAHEVDRLYHARRDAVVGPKMQESPAGSGRYRVCDVEQRLMLGNVGQDGTPPCADAGYVSSRYSSRGHVARLALLEPEIFAECVHQLDERERDRVKDVARLITAFVSGLSKNSIRTRRDLAWRARRLGIDEGTTDRLLTEHVVGRPMAIPPSAYAGSKDADVRRTASFLLRLVETLRVDAEEAAKKAETRALEDAVSTAIKEEALHELAESDRVEAERDEMRVNGDDLWLAGME